MLSEALSPTLSHYRFYNFRVCSQKPKVQRIILTLPNKGCSFISSPRDGDLMEPAFSRSLFSPVFHYFFVSFSQVSYSGKWNPYICTFSGLIVEKKIVAYRADAYDAIYDNFAVFSLLHTLPLTCVFSMHMY